MRMGAKTSKSSGDRQRERERKRGSADLLCVGSTGALHLPGFAVAGRRLPAYHSEQPTGNVETWCYSWEVDGNQSLGRDVIRCASDLDRLRV